MISLKEGRFHSAGRSDSEVSRVGFRRLRELMGGIFGGGRGKAEWCLDEPFEAIKAANSARWRRSGSFRCDRDRRREIRRLRCCRGGRGRKRKHHGRFTNARYGQNSLRRAHQVAARRPQTQSQEIGTTEGQAPLPPPLEHHGPETHRDVAETRPKPKTWLVCGGVKVAAPCNVVEVIVDTCISTEEQVQLRFFITCSLFISSFDSSSSAFFLTPRASCRPHSRRRHGVAVDGRPSTPRVVELQRWMR